MNTLRLVLHRAIAFMLVTLLAVPLSEAASAQAIPDAPRPQQTTPATPAPPQAATDVASLPDPPVPQNDPGSQQQQQPAPQQPADSQATAQQQPANTQATTPQQQGNPSQPMGTAVAPAQPSGGVAATRPAGAAIAPARQKRSHTLAIRVALIVGAAVAIGTVVGLSAASPSRP